MAMLLGFIGGMALILGFWPHIVALIMAPLLVGTIVALHAANGFIFSNLHGSWEYAAFWSLALIALASIGDRVYAPKPTPALKV